MSGLWCASLGFSNRRLAEAAQRQFDVLPYYHTFNHRVPAVTVRLAERIAALAPLPDAKVFFACSGSEANDSMIKMSWAWHRARGNTHKRKIIAHQKGFHGSTVMGATLSGLPNMHAAFGLPLDQVIHVECPHYYRNGLPGETEAAFCERLVADLQQRIEAEGADTIADRVYLGDHLRIHLKLGNGDTLIVKTANDEAIKGLNNGQHIGFTWRPEDARVFPRG